MFVESLVFSLIFGLSFAQWNLNMWEDRNTIVHLFDWKFSDIADECERFLQYKGYGGVQVSPVSENAIIEYSENGYPRPWWERYQPISYNIVTRSGNEADFEDMSRRCNAVGVRIYVDVILNHMTGNIGYPVGTGGSTANTYNKDYPAVPYNSSHFHSDCDILDYDDEFQVRYCQLTGLIDLDQSNPYVRNMLIGFLNKLVSLGVAGFRVDAAKHMWVEDLQYIYSQVEFLNTDYGFEPYTRPFFYQEVIDKSGSGAIKSSDYVKMGRVTEFKHSVEIGRVFRGNDQLRWLENWGTGWSFLESEYAFIFVDNHDNQRRQEDDPYDYTLTYKQSKQYKMAIAFMLAHPYGETRVMSGFAFDDNDQGPPADSNGNIISAGINADDTCSNGWVCEHRWRQIYNMVGFRNAVKSTDLTNWWSDGAQQITFCRGDKGFVAFTNGGSIYQNMQTCLPPGVYCDVISGNLMNGECTGKSIYVDSSGYGYITLYDTEEDGVLALHVNAKL